MKARQNILRLAVCLILTLTLTACARPKSEPVVPPLPEVTKELSKAKIVKDHYLYALDPALCKETEQFLVKEDQIALPVPEKAIKFNLQKLHPSASSVSKVKPAPESSAPANALTVFFDVNSSVIEIHEKQKLDQFIKKLPPGAEVKITGYTCRLGSAKYNQKLALDRAKSIAFFLSKKGIHAQSVTGNSGCCYISETDPAKNRRAEILVLPAKETPTSETNAKKEVVKERNNQ